MLFRPRNFGFIAILAVMAVVFSCSEEKTTTPKTNNPPATPSSPSPAHQATGIASGTLLLNWHDADPDGDSIKYDVYFDTLPDPVLVSSNQIDTTYQVNNLEVSREYYWKVVAKDEHGSETASPIWHFSTIPGQERITFTSQGDNGPRMCMMNADGSNKRIIGDTAGMGDGQPSLSYDGSKIAFIHSLGGMYSYIWTMNVDGSNRFEVTHEDLEAFGPVLSPDGSKIAFLVTEGSVMPSAIYIVDATGGTAQRITDFIVGAESWKLSWSPDGNKIAFDDGTICTINVNGTGFQRLTDNSTFSGDPAWSHDGTRIAFSKHLIVDYQEINQIFVMNADGSNPHNITNTMGHERGPCWSPDDSQIAFSSDRDGDWIWNIYVMNADGSNQHSITNDQDINWQPSWGPWHR